MNELKKKKTQSIHQPGAPLLQQRRVSFSKPWTQSRAVDQKGSQHRSKNKSHPVPRVPYSRSSLLCKPSVQSERSSLSSKGASAKARHEQTPSISSDLRRRSADPTPAHLKYGMFRRFSKLRKQSTESAPLRGERAEAKPRQEDQGREPLTPKRSSTHARVSRHYLGTNLGYTRRVQLCRTEPIHLDIKPKRFPSMLWC